MEFTTNKPIYRQIIDYSFGRILTRAWLPDERVPSVRELGVELGVNSHTVLKAYEFLQASEVIIPRRGMGFYLASDAEARVNALRREEFFSATLPALAEEMKMLGITPDELLAHLRDIIAP